MNESRDLGRVMWHTLRYSDGRVQRCLADFKRCVDGHPLECSSCTLCRIAGVMADFWPPNRRSEAYRGYVVQDRC